MHGEAVRVCHFTDSAAFGGAEQALLTLVGALDRRRFAPVLIHHPSPELDGMLAAAQALDVEVVAVPPMPDGATGLRRAPAFAATVRRLRPAVFHAHLTWPLGARYALAGAIAARVPAVVATVQLFPPFRPLRRALAVHRGLTRGIGAYLAVSEDVAARMRRLLRQPAGRVHVVHNAIDLAPFSGPRDAALHDALAGGSGPLVLTAARLEEQKGIGHLLEAARLVPDARFAIAGDGPQRRGLEARAGALALGDRVRFLGHRDDLPALLAACDLFVLPSLWEGLPVSVLEAMAAARPVVATAIPGTDEAVQPGMTGLLVPPRDAPALAAAIGSLLADPARAARIGEAGRARVRARFSAAALGARVGSVYDRLLATHAG